MLPNGEFIFFGRKDTQIKIRGFRVEPSEIDSVITQHPKVKLTKVIFKSDISELVAYIVPKTPDSSFNENEIQKFCEEKLPYYMVPRYIMILDEIPLNRNAKLDVSKLPDLRQIFMKNEEMGSNFVKNEKIDLNFIPNDVAMETCYPHQLLSKTEEIVTAPTCILQNGLLLALSKNKEAYQAYNNQIRIRLSQNIDLERVKHAIFLLAQRHSSLKTVFKKENSKFLQEIRPEISLEQIFQKPKHEIFEETLFSAQFLDDGPSKILELNLHHLISDGHSMNILARDLQGV